jgi:hypothetical protein
VPAAACCLLKEYAFLDPTAVSDEAEKEDQEEMMRKRVQWCVSSGIQKRSGVVVA